MDLVTVIHELQVWPVVLTLTCCSKQTEGKKKARKILHSSN